MRTTEGGVQFAIGAAIKTNACTFKTSDSEPKLKGGGGEALPAAVRAQQHNFA